MKRYLLSLVLAAAFLFGFSTPITQANHSWGGYHWARTSNPFTLKLGDNLSSGWDPYLATTSFDWSQSSVSATTIVPGATTAKRCRATSGRVEVCNSKYGTNGWLGLAQIWLNGSHIVQGVTKVNDTYFAKAQYNTSAWKNLVMCQEVGHTLGLDHQDEIFNNANLGTCMDYSDDPSGAVKSQLNNEHPNTHDYNELAIIYEHFDNYTSIQSGSTKLPRGLTIAKGILDGAFESKSEWGKELRNNKKVALYERDFGRGQKLITFIILAE